MFASARDATLISAIYCRIPILDKEETPEKNAWHVQMRRMFHMGDDSHLFRVQEDLCEKGFKLSGNVFSTGAERYLPLYEAKLAHQFNHRAATFEGIDRENRFGTHPPTRSITAVELQSPDARPIPRYWVSAIDAEKYVKGYRYLLGFRNAVSAVADARSLVASILPPYGAGDSLRFMFGEDGPSATCLLLSLLNSVLVDYIFRQKASGGNASFFILRQLPLIAPTNLGKRVPWQTDTLLAAWITPRVVELSYTASDLADFALECGYDGPPFRWDEDRRFLLRCELDAAFFHLYVIDRDDADYVMENFPIVKRRDEEQHGEYRTKRVILEFYDAMAEAIRTGHPYQTLLDPPPGPPAAGLPDWQPGLPRPANWPSHIHPPRSVGESSIGNGK